MIDLFSRIKRETPPDRHDLTTAEGRAAWDAELRDFVNNIEDDSVRGHLGALVKEWRWQVLGRVGERLTDKVNRLEAELAHLRAEVESWQDMFPAYRGVMRRRLAELKRQPEPGAALALMEDSDDD